MLILKKSLLVVAVTFVAVSTVFADRGVGKKNKNRSNLNIATNSNLRSSIGFNLKSGLSYKGSLLVNRTPYMNTSISTYQKGNTIYIIPQKQKFAVAEMKQGYTGIKIIIKKSKK